MFKFIYGMFLLVFLMVITLNVAHAQKPTEVIQELKKSSSEKNNHAANQKDNMTANAKRAALKNGLSEENAEAVCLAADLLETEIAILTADVDESAANCVIDGFKNIYEHVKGHTEEAFIQNLLEKENATLEDLLNTVSEIKKSLQNRLPEEQRFYFDLTMTVIKLDFFLTYYLEEQIKDELYAVQRLVKTAPANIPQEITQSLNKMAQFADKQQLSTEDFLALTEENFSIITVLVE